MRQSFVSCCYNTQEPWENDCGIGNEGTGFLFNSKISERCKVPNTYAHTVKNITKFLKSVRALFCEIATK